MGKANGVRARKPDKGAGAAPKPTAAEIRLDRTTCPGGISDHLAHVLTMDDGVDQTELVAFEPMTHANIMEAFSDLEDGFWALHELRLLEAHYQANNDEESAFKAGKGIDALIRCMTARAAVGRRFADVEAAPAAKGGAA